MNSCSVLNVIWVDDSKFKMDFFKTEIYKINSGWKFDENINRPKKFVCFFFCVISVKTVGRN